MQGMRKYSEVAGNVKQSNNSIEIKKRGNECEKYIAFKKCIAEKKQEAEIKKEMDEFVKDVVKTNTELIQQRCKAGTYKKVAIAYDTDNPKCKGIATSGMSRKNIYIFDEAEKDYLEKIKKEDRFKKNLGDGKIIIDYRKLHSYLLTQEYINSLDDSFFENKKTTKEHVLKEMGKFVETIKQTREKAKEERKFMAKVHEPSFEKLWNVMNCAEVWAVRKAILNGAKWDNINYACVHTPYNTNEKTKYARPCENCKRTFSKVKDKGKEWDKEGGRRK